MIFLKLLNCETGEIMTVARDTYGVIMEKFLKLAPAISDGWSLYVENKLGFIIHRSEYHEIQCEG